MVEKSTSSTGKGRATPTRKAAEAARKKAMTTPVSRKQRTKADRNARQQQREKARDALKNGTDDKLLPIRDRGPVRGFCRDYVDRRYNVAEFLLPILVVILGLSFVAAKWAVLTVFAIWVTTVFGTIIDEFIMIRGLKKQLADRFTDENTRGTTPYSVLRSSQLRRFRLPKPRIKHGDALKNRY